MSARVWCALYVAVFAGTFAATWAVSGGHERPTSLVVQRARVAQTRGAPVAAVRARPEPLPGTPGNRPVKIVEVEPDLTLEQQMILDYGLPASTTWAAVNRAVLDLLNSKVELALAGESSMLPWDCGDGLASAEPPVAAIHVRATAERVVAFGYEVISPDVSPEVAECLEEYFSGEAVVDAIPDVGPFLELETTMEQPAY